MSDNYRVRVKVDGSYRPSFGLAPTKQTKRAGRQARQARRERAVARELRGQERP